MDKVLLYGFQSNGEKNISMAIINKLNIQNSIILDCNDLESFQSSAEHLLALVPNYEYIIGLGQYSGRDSDKIRVEGLAKNIFRNGTIHEEGMASYALYQPDLGWDSQDRFKQSKAMGNSWCNLSAYIISEIIHEKKYKTKLLFLHIPKSFPVEQAVELINDLMSNLNSIKN